MRSPKSKPKLSTQPKPKKSILDTSAKMDSSLNYLLPLIHKMSSYQQNASKLSLNRSLEDSILHQSKLHNSEAAKSELAHFTELLRKANNHLAEGVVVINSNGTTPTPTPTPGPGLIPEARLESSARYEIVRKILSLISEEYAELGEALSQVEKELEGLVVCRDKKVYAVLEKVSNQVIFERSKQLCHCDMTYIVLKEVGGWLKRMEEGRAGEIQFPRYTVFDFAQEVLSARDVYKKNSTIVEMKKKAYEIELLQGQVASLKAKLEEQQKSSEQKYNEKVKEKDVEIIDLRQKIRDQKEEYEVLKEDNQELQKSLIQISQLIKTNTYLEERTKLIMDSSPMNTRYNYDNNFQSAFLKIES